MVPENMISQFDYLFGLFASIFWHLELLARYYVDELRSIEEILKWERKSIESLAFHVGYLGEGQRTSNLVHEVADA
jgi:hypothetical protein